MQTSLASDPSFKAFLEKLQEQNSRGFVTQLVQLKADRENVGKDNDKREEQLDEVVSSLNEVRTAVTGINLDIDFTPLINIGENQTKLLEELSRENSLTRKLTEGSVEYDKEAAQYRNTSGRDIESKVSGKTSKDGGFIDFETARDTLSGQGKRAREDNAFSLKPISYTPGKAAAAAVGGKEKSPGAEEGGLDKPVFKGFLEEIKSGFKFFMTDGLSQVPGYGPFQEPPKDVEKKEKETKVSSPRQENPEADNIASTGEIQADTAKSDLEISKQMLDTTKAQLVELKAIREALAPKTPKDLIKKEPKGTGTPLGNEEGGGGGSLIGDLASGAMDLMGSKGKLGKMGRGLMTAGKAALPYAAAAGVAVAGGAAVDYGLGKLGVGKDKEGNDLKVDTAQDDANWAKMSTGQKIQSGLARGIEKTGSALFLGNLSKEAQATRIKKETDYLNKNTPGAATKEALAPAPATVKDQVPAAVEEPQVKFKRSKRDSSTIGGRVITGFEGGYILHGKKEDVEEADAAYDEFRNAEDDAAAEAAASKFKTLAAKIQSPEYQEKMKSISKAQQEKKKAAIDPAKEEKVTGGPGAKNPAVLAPEALSPNQILRERDIARTKEKAALVAPSGNGSGILQSGQILDQTKPKTLDEIAMGEAKKYGRDTPNFDDKKAAQKLFTGRKALEEANNAKIPVVEKKSVDTSAPGAVAAVAMGAAASVAVKKEAGPNWKAALESYKDSTPVDHLNKQYPGIDVKFKELAGKSTPRSDSLQSIQIHEQVIKLKALDELTGGKSTASAKSDSVTLTETVADPKLSEAKLSEAKSVTPVDGRSAMVKQREESRRTTFGALYEDTPSVMKKANNLRDQATKLGIDPNKAQGTMEGGVLTKITDTSSGKEHDIEVSEKDKRSVAAAREMRAMNENSGRLAAAASAKSGLDVIKTSTENADMGREAGKGGSNNTVVSNNVSSNNTTKFVPMKSSPRPEYTGSSLDRYTNRITVY